MTGVRLSYGFGIEKDKNGRYISPIVVTAAMREIEKRAVGLFGGFALRPVQGGRVNSVGQLVEERGYSLEIVIPNNNTVTLKETREFGQLIKQLLNQEAIVFTVSQCITAEIG